MVFVDPIRLVRWGGVVSCWRPQGHGANAGGATRTRVTRIAVLAADRLGPKIYKYASAFGFGARTGVDFRKARGVTPTG